MKTQIIQIKIKEDLNQRIKEQARETGLPVSAFCRFIILNTINKERGVELSKD
jgi:antitoxin component of RelBE/YafQ-DinJ toxin-antitoxin module